MKYFYKIGGLVLYSEEPAKETLQISMQSDCYCYLSFSDDAVVKVVSDRDFFGRIWVKGDGEVCYGNKR